MPGEIVSRILRLPGYGVYAWEAEDLTGTLRLWIRQTAAESYYVCGGCGISVRDVHSWTERELRDLPWGTWQVWLVVEVHRVRCRRYGVRTERLPFLTGKARAICVDMWEPFVQSLRAHLPHARIVYDKFHVLRHVIEALDETRRAEFFRKGGQARGLFRGKRWLLLRRWADLERNERRLVTELLALNRRLAKAYLLKEQLAHLWDYTYEGAARRFLTTWLRALRWQRLPAFRKVAQLLLRHLDGILAYCHEKVPFGKVEAINGNIRAMLRRGRGYRDHEYLLLKVQKATAERRRLLKTA